MENNIFYKLKEIITTACLLFVFVLDISLANKLCEQNKRKIEEKILLLFWGGRDYSRCYDLHILYPQMQPNECQDIQNILKKYVFKVDLKNDLATPNQCITQVSVKFNYDINDEAIEKIKTGLKSLDDGNRAYLRFMRGDSSDSYDNKEYREDVLLLYRFVGDKLFKDFNKYKSNITIDGQHLLDVRLAKDITETEGYWGIDIKHGVLDFSSLGVDKDYLLESYVESLEQDTNN